MKTKSLLIALALCFATPVMAQKAVYACQYINSAGLYWKSGRWEQTGFTLQQPFFLTSVNNSLTKESVGQVLGVSSVRVYCHEKYFGSATEIQTCSDRLGGVLSFSDVSGNGAVAQTLSGTQNTSDKVKDTLSISPFTCTKVQ